LSSISKQTEIIELFKQAIRARRNRNRVIKIVQCILEVAEKSTEFRDALTFEDIDLALSNGLGFHNLHRASDDDVTKYVKKTLFTRRKYRFYYPLYFTYNYPENYQIGYCIGKQFEHLPSNIKKEFETNWSFEFEGHKGFFRNLEEYLENRRESLFLYIATESNGQFKCTQKAEALVDRSLDVLRIIYRNDVVAYEYCIASDEGNWQGLGGITHDERSRNHRGAWSYQPHMNEEFVILNTVLAHKKSQKKKPEVLEKLSNAMHLFAAATSARYNEVKYVLLCSALEAMLLDESDYLGLRLSERAAFLIEKPSKRRERFREIYLIYNKRSRIVHQDKDQPTDLPDSEINNLENLVIRVASALFRLDNDGYKYFRDDEKSILNYFDSLKFEGKPMSKVINH
jgi:hypothetical protein